MSAILKLSHIRFQYALPGPKKPLSRYSTTCPLLWNQGKRWGSSAAMGWESPPC